MKYIVIFIFHFSALLALVSQLARIAEWAEQKAGHMLYIAGPDNFDQYMMNRPIESEEIEMIEKRRNRDDDD